MTIEREDIAEMTDEALFEIAENEDLFLARAWAMDELAKRALTQRSSIERLLKSVGKNIAIRGRNGAPLGTLAAQIIAANLDENWKKQVAVSATSWSALDQQDFFWRFFEDNLVKSIFEELVSYGMVPKITVDDNGNVEPQSQ